MDCSSARLFLHFDRPGAGELDADDAQALSAHLHECPDCAAHAHADRGLDEKLSQAMNRVEVPPGLRTQLLARLTVERGDWYRRRFGHLTRACAAAVALLLVGWGIWHWRNVRRPEVNLETVFEDFHYQGHERGPGSADEVKEAFAQMGVKIRPPSDYNYAYLSHYGLAELPGSDGRRVPRLEFRRSVSGRERRAIVYILSKDQFKLESLAQSQGVDRGYSSKLDVDYMPEQGVAYLTFYNGPNLDWLRGGGTDTK